MRLRSLSRKMTYAASAFALAVGLGVASSGTASAVTATGCGASSAPVLESHPVTIWADNTNLGQIYLGWFPDCKGVYAEIHWTYGPSTPFNDNAGNSQNVEHPQGRLYMNDPNGHAIAYTSFRLDHLDGSYTTTPVQSIYTNPAGQSYTNQKLFMPIVDLTNYSTDSEWHQNTTCNKTIFGNDHNFNNGAWGSGNYGDC
ncbi:hypothetical protein ABH932_005811 [Streptacidiphilus sp. MAP5-52]